MSPDACNKDQSQFTKHLGETHPRDMFPEVLGDDEVNAGFEVMPVQITGDSIPLEATGSPSPSHSISR